MSTRKEVRCKHFRDYYCNFEACRYWNKEKQECAFENPDEKEMNELQANLGMVRGYIANKVMPRKRFKPMPLKVGVTPEDGVEPTDEDLIFEHIPLSKRVNPKKRGAVNGRKRK